MRMFDGAQAVAQDCEVPDWEVGSSHGLAQLSDSTHSPMSSGPFFPSLSRPSQPSSIHPLWLSWRPFTSNKNSGWTTTLFGSVVDSGDCVPAGPTFTNNSELPPCGVTAIGPTTVYHGPALFTWILSPIRIFQNHEVGLFSAVDPLLAV